MRLKLLLVSAASLSLLACGTREQSNSNGIVADEGFSIENSSANDITAIDAATADAAGMAADAEANLSLDELDNEGDGNTPAPANSDVSANAE